MKRLLSVLLSYILLLPTMAQADVDVTNTDPTLSAIAKQLPNAKLKNMHNLVEKIAQTSAPQTRDILQFMLEGELYYLKSNKTLVRAVKAENAKYTLTSIMTDETFEPVSKSSIRKIKTNNRLRGNIRSYLAELDLTSKDKDTRIAAVKQLLDNASSDGLAAVKRLLPKEQDDDVRELMNVTLALDQLKTGDHEEQLAAITQLSDTLEPEVNNVMVAMLASLPESKKTPDQLALAKSLTKAIESIESQRSFFGFLENIFFGLSLGLSLIHI